MEERVIYRFLWWPMSLRFGHPKKWLVFKGIVQTYHPGSVTATGGYNLFGDKAYNWSSSHWSNERWYSGAVNEARLTSKAVIKGLLWSGFTLLSALLGLLILGRIGWDVVPLFWEAISHFGVMFFNFLFGWML